jgi:hypothetical protein
MKSMLVVLTVLLAAAPLAAQNMHVYPHEEGLLEVLFIQESQVRLVGGVPFDESGLMAHEGVLDVLAPYGGGTFERLVDLPVELLDDWAAQATLTHGEPVYNLNNIYTVHVSAPGDEIMIAYELESLPGVELAYPVALPPELPIPGSYVSQQNYLDPPAVAPPTGVDALWAWTQPGGAGNGVTVCDLEYNWNRSHQDLTQLPFAELNTNVADPGNNADHGTMVAGVLASDANSWGTTGICYGATLKTCGTYYGFPTPYWNGAGAIAIAAFYLQAGDVILLEQQWDYTGSGGHVPVEWYPHTSGQAQSVTAVYAAIQNATGIGIHVVEAGGNGGIDTDTMTWQGDSGAIIVGAGGAYSGGYYPNGDLQTLWYSSYGSRFDVQGWGENVVTTGKGDLWNESPNLQYTNSFTGTSSASPMVAGAVACISAWYKQNVSTTPLSTAAMRATLIATGTPQAPSPASYIGPRPDIRAAILSITPPPQWVDATAGPLGDTGYGRSVAWDDYDLDGDDDLYVTNFQGSNRLLRNDGPTGFTDVTTFPVDNLMPSCAAEWGDFDNDGRPDIYCANYNFMNRLYLNTPLNFMDHTGPPLDDPGDGYGVTWVDYDRDGLLDLHLTNINGYQNKLFKAFFGSLFLDATVPPLDDTIDSHDAAWADYDNDGDLDCYVVRWGQPNDLLVNDGLGNFNYALPGSWNNPGNGSGACWGDYDNDGDLDLYLVNFGSSNRLFRNDGIPGIFDITSGVMGDMGQGRGAAWADYDNDGDLDLYLANHGTANRLFRNDGPLGFVDATVGPLGDTGAGEGVAWADYDNDGDLDLYLVNYGSANRLFRNDVNSGNNWVQVRLTGISSNAQGLGARVRIVSGGQVQIRELGAGDGYCGQSTKRLHFGLGAAAFIDTLRVTWPSGVVQDTLGLLPNGTIDIQEWYAVGVDAPLPRFGLEDAQPNPFNPVTEIAFSIERDGHVELKLFNLRGELIDVLCDEQREAGRHVVAWRPEGQPSGTYFYVLRAGGREDVGRCQLIK